MGQLSWQDLIEDAGRWDELALAAGELDRFCASSAWNLSAVEAFSPAGQPWAFACDEGLLVFARREHQNIRVIEPCEASWALACPLIGPQPDQLVLRLAERLNDERDSWDVCVLAGVPIGSSVLLRALAELGTRYRLGLGITTQRHVASLAGGVDGFLARRSRSVRKSLRQARRRASELGIEFELLAPHSAADAEQIYQRVLAIERRSWKGAGDHGITGDEMGWFYRCMSARLAEAGRLRVQFARQGDLDCAYVLGAVFGDTYRGLQFSFDDRLRAVGLGNLCQLRQIEALAGEPAVTRYDLGTGGAYKARWAEATQDSVVVLVWPR